MEQIQRRLHGHLEEVEIKLEEALYTDDPFLDRLLGPLPKAGGKRIRPILVLLSVECFTPDISQGIPLAVCAELMHTATLIHDDVVDHAGTRRGQPTMHSRWGNKIAILAGDHVFAKAFDVLAQLKNIKYFAAMSGMIAGMGAGEILQIFHAYDVSLAEGAYFERIKRKTALFMGTCCELGALAGGASDEVAGAMYEYGLNLGMAFQVADDLLDFMGDARKVGKPVASDLLEGNITLPVLHAMRQKGGQTIRRLIEQRSLTPDDIATIIGIAREAGSLEYAAKVAERFVDRALQQLEMIPESQAKADLIRLARYSINRQS
ncbi:MAG: polyprenyl synthetase family protein [Firmicutes bacterium]|nr:polyprenyl synthetase family protein [Bacillota bacterium]